MEPDTKFDDLMTDLSGAGDAVQEWGWDETIGESVLEVLRYVAGAELSAEQLVTLQEALEGF